MTADEAAAVLNRIDAGVRLTLLTHAEHTAAWARMAIHAEHVAGVRLREPVDITAGEFVVVVAEVFLDVVGREPTSVPPTTATDLDLLDRIGVRILELAGIL